MSPSPSSSPSPSPSVIAHRKLLDLEGLETLFFYRLIPYTPNRFIQLDFFLICDFLSEKFEKNVKFSRFTIFVYFLIYIFCVFLILELNLNIYKSKVLIFLYNRVKSIFKCCCIFGDNWMFSFKNYSNF